MLRAAAVLCAVSAAAALAPTLAGAATLTPVAVELPPALQALEQKMAQLNVNSERYTRTISGQIRSTIHVKHGKLRTRTRHISSKSYGEVSLSAARGKLSSAGGRPMEIVVGSTDYVYLADIARRDGGRPWVRVDHGSAALLFPFYEPTAPAGEVRVAGTGSYAELIDLMATAVGPVDAIGAAMVDGQQTSEFTARVEPLKLIKGPSGNASAEPKEGLREKLEVFITEAGLPIRVVLGLELREPGGYVSTSQTMDITDIEVPVTVAPPPVGETIGEAEFEKLLRSSSGGHTIKVKL